MSEIIIRYNPWNEDEVDENGYPFSTPVGRSGPITPEVDEQGRPSLVELDIHGYPVGTIYSPDGKTHSPPPAKVIVVKP